jgi:hypothetical protein
MDSLFLLEGRGIRVSLVLLGYIILCRPSLMITAHGNWDLSSCGIGITANSSCILLTSKPVFYLDPLLLRIYHNNIRCAIGITANSFCIALAS